MHASPNRDLNRPVQAQDLAAFGTDTAAVQFPLTEFRAVPKSTPTLSHSHSLSINIILRLYAWEIVARVHKLSSQPVLLYTQVSQFMASLIWVSCRSYPTASSAPEAITMTFPCYGSVRPVYTTTSFRPISPCQPTPPLAGPVFSHL